MRGFAAVIPARNESRTITNVVSAASRHVDTVIVCDDGSTDDTRELAKLAGAQVVLNFGPNGYGAALNCAAQAATKLGFSGIVTLDSDGAHDPDEIGNLLKYHVQSSSDLTIGSRFTEIQRCEVPTPKLHANMFAKGLFNRAVPINVSDLLSGMRVISGDALRILPDVRNFSWTPRLIDEAVQMKHIINEYPISVRYNAASLHSTQAIEIVHFLEYVLELYIRNGQECIQVEKMLELIHSWSAFRVIFDQFEYFLFPVLEHKSYIFQKQIDVFYRDQDSGTRIFVEETGG